MNVTLVAVGVLVLAFVATAAVVLVRTRRGFVTITVEGMSMSPALLDGDRVLVSRRARTAARNGDVVVVERPGDDGWFIKRVVATGGETIPDAVRARRGLPDGAVVASGEVMVLGDHPASEDSKQWGALPVDRVVGVVVRKL
ncbi:signal peptidase I [Catenulispora subtropica]|uniref:Signal peptidase I n=1 Tax=Catenulispora subtropica TaxID=450798 RepID=A0ABN2QXV5_9ACTN